jgi:RimJ/RimL family protein N-acetyltransferase
VAVRTGPRVCLHHISLSDGPEFIELAARRADHFRGFVWAPQTPAEFEEYVIARTTPGSAGFVIRANHTGELTGFVSVRRGERGPALGYGSFAPGLGYTGEGVALAVDYAFADLHAARLVAAIQKRNPASIRIVERLGFQPTDAAEPIEVDGEWHEHQWWLLTADLHRG